MFVYNTLTEAIEGLKRRNYTIDFNLDFDCIVCHKTPARLTPEEFKITEFHRFEGETDPGDENIVYAIESKSGLKGILVSAFGAYSDPISDEMISKLKISR